MKPTTYQTLTKARSKAILNQAREDIAALLSKRYEDIEEAYRILAITGELYVGITGEEPEPVQVRAFTERTA